MPLTLEFEVEQQNDLHEALLARADWINSQIAATDERLARMRLSERLEREGVDTLWIKQLRAREAGLRRLALALSQLKPESLKEA